MNESIVILTTLGLIVLIGLVSIVMDFIEKDEEVILVKQPVNSNITQIIDDDLLISETLLDD